MTENDVRGLLREMRDEALPADSLARVRMRVAERTGVRRRWRIAAWVLVPLCALAVALALRNPAPPRMPVRQEARVAPVTPAGVVEPALIRTVKHRVVRRKQLARRAPEVPVLIRIETDDPEVVILLVGN